MVRLFYSLVLLCLAVSGLSGVALAEAEIPQADLQLWLRADAGVERSPSGRVTLWQDQSGKGNHAYGIESGPIFVENALNGMPALAFDGESTFLAVPHNANGGLNADSAFSVIVVYRYDEADRGNLNRVMQKRSNAIGTGYDSWFIAAGRGLGVANSRALKDIVEGGEFAIHTGVFDHDAGKLALYVNGTLAEEAETLAPQTPNSHPLFIGKREYQTELPLKGEIAEILIYKSALSDEDRVAIESYLEEKYGL